MLNLNFTHNTPIFIEFIIYNICMLFNRYIEQMFIYTDGTN